MSSLDQIANVVRSVRLGALTWPYAVAFGDGNRAGAADSQTWVAVCLDSATRDEVNC
jgi:hypothetical protein